MQEVKDIEQSHIRVFERVMMLLNDYTEYGKDGKAFGFNNVLSAIRDTEIIHATAAAKLLSNGREFPVNHLFDISLTDPK